MLEAFIWASKPAVAVLVVAALVWIVFRRVTGRIADWPTNIATLSVPLSAALLLLTARPTQRGEVLDSNFLAIEIGCWSLIFSFVLVWSIVWLLQQKQRRERTAIWKRVLAVVAGLISVWWMLSVLPLRGRPDL